MTTNHRGTSGYAVGLFLGAVGVVILFLLPRIDLTVDGVRYLSAARSLGAGDGLWPLGLQVMHQAPGYAAAIAPLTLLGEGFPWALLVFHAAAAIIYLILVRVWFGDRLPNGSALLVSALAVLCLLNAATLSAFKGVNSETLFLPLLLGAVVLLDRSIAGGRVRTGGLLLGIALLSAAAMTRNIGSMWAVGFAVVAVVRLPGWRGLATGALACGVVAATVGLWLWRESIAGNQGPPWMTQTALTYVGQSTSALDPGAQPVPVVLDGVRLQIITIGRMFVPGMLRSDVTGAGWWDPNLLVYLPIVLAIVLGSWKGLRREPRHALQRDNEPSPPPVWRPGGLPGINTMVVGSCISVAFLAIAWPMDQGARFAIPLMPAVVWSFLHLIPSTKWASQMLATFITLHLLGAIVFLLPDRLERWNGPPLTEEARTMLIDVRGGSVADYARLNLDRRAALELINVLDRDLPTADGVRGDYEPTPRWLFGTGDIPPGYVQRGTTDTFWLAEHAGPASPDDAASATP